MSLTSEITKLVRFGFVGVLATLTHLVIGNFVQFSTTLAPQICSFFGFIVAFIVSYLGHFHFTFRDQSKSLSVAGKPLFKFAVIAISGFLISLFVLTGLEHFKLGQSIYRLSFSILIIPLLTFLLSNFWAFRADE
jgi:putative flippase GtrA